RGEVDESTLKGSAYRAVASGAYRGSPLQTAVVARMIETHRNKGTWGRVPDRLIALTNFAKRKFTEGGIPEERIAVKPNFIRDPLPEMNPSADSDSEPGILFAGRIEEEKGIDELVEAWINEKIQTPLYIAGDGTKKEYLEKLSVHNHSIKWLGSIDRDELLSRMRASLALIFPSRWYEGMPMTILEAKALGCPVITADIGNHADLVNDGQDGLHYRSGETGDLAEKVELITSNPELRERLSGAARKDYERCYTPDRNYSQLMKIYEEAAEVRRRVDGA
ncbi:MAG: glycosyltransferase family 4 protein, partial [Balneolaceae bacterium]|nr:glycosyltransferase family 4 protein [Balneolaceae bacterium]